MTRPLTEPARPRAEAMEALETARVELERAIQSEREASMAHTNARNHLERARKVYGEARSAMLVHFPEAEKVRE